MEITFFHLDKQTILQEALEHLTDILDVFFQAFSENEDLVKVNRGKLSNHGAQKKVSEADRENRRPLGREVPGSRLMGAIIRAVWRQGAGLAFTEYLATVVVFGQYRRQVKWDLLYHG